MDYHLTVICLEKSEKIQFFQPWWHHLSLDMVPVILSREPGGPEGQASWGWLTGCLAYQRESYRLLPFLQFASCCASGLSLVLASLIHILVCILCSSVLAADPRSSSSICCILIFGFCPLSPYTWQNSAHWWWPGCLTLLNLISPWPCLTQTVQLSGFHSVSGGTVILALQLSISQLGQFAEPWLSSDHVLYFATLWLGPTLWSSTRPQIPFLLTPWLITFPFHPGSNL